MLKWLAVYEQGCQGVLPSRLKAQRPSALICLTSSVCNSPHVTAECGLRDGKADSRSTLHEPNRDLLEWYEEKQDIDSPIHAESLGSDFTLRRSSRLFHVAAWVVGLRECYAGGIISKDLLANLHTVGHKSLPTISPGLGRLLSSRTTRRHISRCFQLCACTEIFLFWFS